MEQQLYKSVSSFVKSVKSVVVKCSKMAQVVCRSNPRTVRHYSYNYNNNKGKLSTFMILSFC